MITLGRDAMESLQDRATVSVTFGQYDLPTLLAAAFAAVTLLAVITRLTSGTSIATSLTPAKSAPSSPYWIPFLRHLPQWLWEYDGALQETRRVHSAGISILKLGSECHNIVSSWKIAHNLQSSPIHVLSDVQAKKRIWFNVFGVPKNQLGLYHELVSAMQIPMRFHFDAEMDAVRMPDHKCTLLWKMQGNMPDLVSFNSSLIDQEPWEKVSVLEVLGNKTVVKASLLPLVFLFLTHIMTDTFVSESLLSDQDHLETGPLLLAFVQSYTALMSGLPRWIPHPILPSAHITRRKLLAHLDALLDHTEVSELQNSLLEARARMLDDHKTPRPIRAIELLRLLHGLNAPHVLAFWMLLHVVFDTQLLEQVRKEAKRAVKVVHEKPVMGFAVPPRVMIDATALLGPETPLLKQCWLESARLYSRGQTSCVATEDFELEGEDGGVFKSADKWSIRKDDWIDVPVWHPNTDATVWEEPEKWDPERHARPEGDDVLFDSKVFDSPGLFGLSEAAAATRLFALAFVASTVLLFDIAPDGDRSIPKASFAAGVALPGGDVRVRIRKREVA